MDFINRNRNIIVAAVIICLIYYFYDIQTEEGFIAPYFIPWWREYNRSPLYEYKERPYWDTYHYWWPHYGRRYFNNYWAAYV